MFFDLFFGVVLLLCLMTFFGSILETFGHQNAPSFCTCGAKVTPEGTDGATWRQNGPKWSPRGDKMEPQRSQMEPKGAEMESKRHPQRAKMTPKVPTCGEIVRQSSQMEP